MQTTLNFLAPEKKSLIRKGFIFAYAQNMLFVVFVAVTFCSGLLLALRIMLGNTRAVIVSQAVGNDRDAAAIRAEIKSVNDYLTRHETYVNGFVRWSDILAELTDAIPAGAELTALRIAEDGNVEISGRALERASVLELEKRLKASPRFKDVTAPLSNILTQRDVTFQFSLTLATTPKLPSTEEVPAERPRRTTR